MGKFCRKEKCRIKYRNSVWTTNNPNIIIEFHRCVTELRMKCSKDLENRTVVKNSANHRQDWMVRVHAHEWRLRVNKKDFEISADIPFLHRRKTKLGLGIWWGWLSTKTNKTTRGFWFQSDSHKLTFQELKMLPTITQMSMMKLSIFKKQLKDANS